jgi:hypothetical protein
VVRLTKNPTMRVSRVEEEPEGAKLSHLIGTAKPLEHCRVSRHRYRL